MKTADSFENLIGRYNLGYLRVDGRILLKLTLNSLDRV
jgi:hypothetical protein